MFKSLFAALLALCAAAAFAAVDANKATQAELETVKGIGPAISAKILDERKKGAFKDWNDMVDRVKGVGDGNAAKLSTGGLTVNGSAFAGAPAAPAAPAAKKDDKPAAKAEAKKDATPAAPAAAAVKADAKPAAMTAEEKKAAAAKAKADKKAAKEAAAADAKTAKADKATAAAAAKPASAPAKK